MSFNFSYYLILLGYFRLVSSNINNIPVIYNASLDIFNQNSTIINGTCSQCLCIMLLNDNITSLNCFLNNQTCQLFSKHLDINTFLLTNNLASSVYFKSLPIDIFTSTTVFGLLTFKNETVYGVWNTSAGGSSINVSIGNYNAYEGKHISSEGPSNVFDQNANSKFLVSGSCMCGNNTALCGVNTGVYLTLVRGATLLNGVQFCTGNDALEHDPMTITIEGSNEISSSTLTVGSSWTLIYNGTTGLNPDPGRRANGTIQYFSNLFWYKSYRILVTTKRGINCVVQYSEIYLHGIGL